MAKVSTIMIFLLFVNIIGYLLMAAMVEEGLAEGNPYIDDNSLLVTFFTPQVTEEGDTFFVLDNSSALTVAVPADVPESFTNTLSQFIDRILILFGFVRVILGVIFFPILLISFMGLPFELNMLLFLPLTTIYILGLFDLFAGGSS